MSESALRRIDNIINEVKEDSYQAGGVNAAKHIKGIVQSLQVNIDNEGLCDETFRTFTEQMVSTIIERCDDFIEVT